MEPRYLEREAINPETLQEGLVERIKDTQQKLRNYLDGLEKQESRRGGASDPVRSKNLTKIIGHLQSLIIFISPDNHAFPNQVDSLVTLLDQLQKPEEISATGAWELADLLEIELVRFGDDAYLQMLLRTQQNTNDAHSWGKRFSTKSLDDLIQKYKEVNQVQDARLEARRGLEYLLQTYILEYRRDRAKMRLRGMYLAIMAWVLLPLTIFLALVYVDPFGLFLSGSWGAVSKTLLLAVIAGAIGSVLSRAIKLGRQPLSSRSPVQGSEPPLGIRALLSVGTIFVAQSFIGATSALVLFLVLETHLVPIGVVYNQSPAGYALIGFLAGFSEPFFIGVLDKVSGGSVYV
ncbi:MAG TPA: hypothetical protein VJ183_05560 [Chloroflexia bacterium]|nr:hypothetical protein [Chloroflexia bacterium]